MSGCDDVRPRLTALLDGELRDEEAQTLRQHLEECPSCAGIMAAYLSLRGEVAAAPPLETDDIWNAVSAQIGADEGSQALLHELRRMREEMTLLRQEVTQVRSEVTDLRHELAKRSQEPITRRLPLSLPAVPSSTQRPYRLV